MVHLWSLVIIFLWSDVIINIFTIILFKNCGMNVNFSGKIIKVGYILLWMHSTTNLICYQKSTNFTPPSDSRSMRAY